VVVVVVGGGGLVKLSSGVKWNLNSTQYESCP
jgi:hypothetical protein